MAESIPPERSAPSGTSATSRSRTAAVTVSRTRSSHSSSGELRRLDCRLPSSARPSRRRPRRRAASAGGSRWTPRRPVRVAGDVLEREVRVERGEVRLAADAPAARAAPSAPTRTRASRRRGASRRAASCRAGRARARAARAARPRARPRTSPRAARRTRGPYSSYRCGMTGVSPRPRTSWPCAASSRAQLGEVVDLAVEDGDDVAASRSRRAGSRARGRSPAAAGGRATHAPNASVEPWSGPRCRMRARIASTRARRRGAGRRIESADPAHARQCAFRTGPARRVVPRRAPARRRRLAPLRPLQRAAPRRLRRDRARPPARSRRTARTRQRWLERARAAAARAPFGLHTHWTSPTHARPTGGDPAERVRREAAWLRERGLEPAFFCGGGWYTDDAVRAAVAELGLVDCTPRTGAPSPGDAADDAFARCARPRRRSRPLPRRTCTRTSTTTTCSTRGGALALAARARAARTPRCDRSDREAAAVQWPLRGDEACCRHRLGRRRPAGAARRDGRHPVGAGASIADPAPRARPADAQRRSRSSSSTSRARRVRSTSRSCCASSTTGERPILWGLPWDAEANWLPFLVLVTVLVFWRGGPLRAARAARRRGPDRLVAPPRDGDHARVRGRHRLPALDLRPLRDRVRAQRRS